MRYDIRFSGSGGQGIITAGILLAQAAAIRAVKMQCKASLMVQKQGAVPVKQK